MRIVNIIGGKEKLFMEKRKYEDSLFLRLRDGERILCPKCQKSFLKPYNTTFDKAHYFECSNCDFHCHGDPIIDIE